MRTETAIVYYNVVFGEESMMPQIMESIKIDENLRVELQYMGNPVPLPPWFVMCRDAKLNHLTQLENFPAYIKNVADNGEHSILGPFSENLSNEKTTSQKGDHRFQVLL